MAVDEGVRGKCCAACLPETGAGRAAGGAWRQAAGAASGPACSCAAAIRLQVACGRARAGAATGAQLPSCRVAACRWHGERMYGFVHPSRPGPSTASRSWCTATWASRSTMPPSPRGRRLESVFLVREPGHNTSLLGVWSGGADARGWRWSEMECSGAEWSSTGHVVFAGAAAGWRAASSLAARRQDRSLAMWPLQRGRLHCTYAAALTERPAAVAAWHSAHSAPRQTRQALPTHSCWHQMAHRACSTLTLAHAAGRRTRRIECRGRWRTARSWYCTWGTSLTLTAARRCVWACRPVWERWWMGAFQAAGGCLLGLLPPPRQTLCRCSTRASLFPTCAALRLL